MKEANRPYHFQICDNVRVLRDDKIWEDIGTLAVKFRITL